MKIVKVRIFKQVIFILKKPYPVIIIVVVVVITITIILTIFFVNKQCYILNMVSMIHLAK